MRIVRPRKVASGTGQSPFRKGLFAGLFLISMATYNVSAALVAGASASPTSGDAPLTVQFTGTASGGNPGTINFNDYPIQSYGGSQDQNPTVTVEDGGAAVRIVANGWKKIAFAYDVTADTILEFDYSSSAQGEVQGIGFDTDDGISAGLTFKLYGTQSWGIATYNDYAGAAPAVKHYTIPVGTHFTGSFIYLTFVNDHDVSSPTAESVFSNIRVYESGSGGGGGYQYAWDFGDGSPVSNEQNPVHTYTSAGTYTAV